MVQEFNIGNTMCSLLAFACFCQILITGIVAYKFAEFIELADCYLATFAGVMSGMMTIPAMIQMKAAQIFRSARVERKYGYTLWYQILVIGTCFILHGMAIIIALSSVFGSNDILNNVFYHMKVYNQKQDSKSLLDNVQWALQCCGAYSYKDWFGVDWSDEHKGLDIETNTLMANKENEIRTNQVPFSCCAMEVLATCLHYDLRMNGTRTINVVGCVDRVDKAARELLWIELITYSVCLSIEIFILVSLCKKPTLKNSRKRTKTRKLTSYKNIGYEPITNEEK